MKKKISMIVFLVFALALVAYGLSLRGEHLLQKGVKQNTDKMKRYEVALKDLEKVKTGWSSLASKLVKDSQALRDYNEGVVRFRLGEVESAKSCFEKASKTVDPVLRARVPYNQGNVLLKENDFLGAAEKYIEALAIKPDDPWIKTNLEIIRAMQKQASEQQPKEGKGKREPKDLKLLPLQEGKPQEGKSETPPTERKW